MTSHGSCSIPPRRRGALIRWLAGPVAAALSLLAPPAAGQAIWHVPEDFPTIQAAIDAAASGDEIVVGPGTYAEALDLGGRSLVLRSSDGPDATWIVGIDNSPGILIENGESEETTVEGFTFADHGRSIIVNGTSPTVRNCVMTNNSASGGGIRSIDGGPRVEQCLFLDNHTSSGGEGPAIYMRSSGGTIIDCAFIDNASCGDGAVALRNGSSPLIQNCLFEGNTAGCPSSSGRGGALLVYLDCDPTIEDCTFIGNSASSDGGTIFCVGDAIFSNCRIEQSGAHGGAYVEQSPVFVDCSFLDNVGNGVDCEAEVTMAVFDRCRFEGNTGVGMTVFYALPYVANCSFTDNGQQGFRNGRGTPYLVNCLIANNGEAGISNNRGHIRVTNSTIANNAGGGMYDIHIYDPYIPELHNVVMWGNAVGGFTGELDPIVVTHSILQSPMPGEGNLVTPPLYVDPDAGDFRLQPGSPAIDAASNAWLPADVTVDLDGNPRLVDGDGDGTAVVDMGAYEFRPAVAALLDIRPGACPNPFNPRSHGVLPVVLLGGEVDVTAVVVESLALARADGLGGSVAPLLGPPGPSPRIVDVATPGEGGPCACHQAGPDGILDLSMKFSTGDLANALKLDGEQPGTAVPLTLTGVLADGTPFTAGDCVTLVGSGALSPLY